MNMSFETVDRATIDGLKPMGFYEYAYVARGEIAINKNAEGMITLEFGDGLTAYGDDIELEIRGRYARLWVWTGYKISAVITGHYDGQTEGE